MLAGLQSSLAEEKKVEPVPTDVEIPRGFLPLARAVAAILSPERSTDRLLQLLSPGFPPDGLVGMQREPFAELSPLFASVCVDYFRKYPNLVRPLFMGLLSHDEVRGLAVPLARIIQAREAASSKYRRRRFLENKALFEQRFPLPK